MKRFFLRWLLIAFSIIASSAGAAETDVLAHLRKGHPRLLCTNEQLAAAIAAAKNDPLRAAVHAKIIAFATSELDTPAIKHELIGPRLLDKSRTCVARVLTCAMAFRLTGDERFAARAKRELFTAAAFRDWNPSHFLDVAEMSFAFAIGYDWLYDQLTPDERRVLKQALLEKSLVFAPDAYAANGPKNKQLWFVTAQHNWNQVCNGGLLSAALALADEEPDLARVVINGARKSLPLPMAAYQPDGAYPEGPGYWGYGTGYNVLAIAMLESALGTDFGLSSAPAFDRTVMYRLYVQSPAGLGFNYADGGAPLGPAPEYTWLAQRFHAEFAESHSRHLLEENVNHAKRGRDFDRFYALHAVWFPIARTTSSASVPPLDARFRGPAELAFFRSAWDDANGVFVGFKAGRNDVNHAHLDLGSFVLDADGIRWVEDLGSDNYNLPAYFGTKRWTYYRLSNHSHNTITPGDALQDPKASAPIIAFGSTRARAFAVADLTAAYPDAAKRIWRGIALLDRTRVLVEDEISGVQRGTQVTSRVVTDAAVTIDDPHRATLRKGGKTLRVEILAPADARFTVAPARPPTADENQNPGASALTAELSATDANVEIALVLTPIGERWPKFPSAPEVTALNSWK